MSENRFGVPTNGGKWQPKTLSGSLPEKFIRQKNPMKSWFGSNGWSKSWDMSGKLPIYLFHLHSSKKAKCLTTTHEVPWRSFQVVSDSISFHKSIVSIYALLRFTSRCCLQFSPQTPRFTASTAVLSGKKTWWWFLKESTLGGNLKQTEVLSKLQHFKTLMSFKSFFSGSRFDIWVLVYRICPFSPLFEYDTCR